MIKTEGSSVVEIVNPEIEEKEEEMAAEGFGADPSISQVEGTSAQNATTNVNPNPEAKIKTEAEVEAAMMAKMKMAIDEAIASEISGIKEEMKSMKAKFEEMAKSPAAGKTMMSAESKETFSSENLQAKQMKIMAELLKNKK